MIELESIKDFNRACLNNFGKLFFVSFYAKWNEHSLTYIKKLEGLLS